jgi:hypothetical protein
MNDFSEIENELKKLRPIEPSVELIARIESDLVDSADCRASVSDASAKPWWWRFTETPYNIGLSLAAAALLLLFARLQLDHSSQAQPPIASASPAQQPARPGESIPRRTGSKIVPAEFIPAGATQTVYRTEDEGLLFPAGSDQPVRRVRSRMRETLRWQNTATGASLRVSYPTEEVTLLPVYGQ